MADAAAPDAVEEAYAALTGRVVVLTGAGLSTDSGIPDYRGPRPAGAPPTRMPMTFQEFVATPANQQRYWARAHVGWSRMGTARPNGGHHALARLEALGRIDLLVTQNVDGLHERAGSQRLVALHGRVAEVVCLDCGSVSGRAAVQARMAAANPGWAARHADAVARPDGDVELDATRGFAVPTCERCGGRLKPHVVFFGENVPRDRVATAQEAVDRADALLVVGSSLTVMSGFRFVRQAARAGTPVVVVNRGATRGDELATHKLELGCSEFLTALVEREHERGRSLVV
ncbi:MAG TPA: NAD-dependent protein deacetylase [Marmoricola sp.]|nr:NAD-dependent protein deacetylase [Marmoricola sp.]